MNTVTLIGRLTKAIELRYTPTGTAYGRFTLAVNRRVVNKEGVREADFISCVIWNKAAENLEKYVHKGSRIGIQGRIETGSYTNQKGQTIYTTDIIVENFDLLDPKQDNSPRENTCFEDFDEEKLPF